MYDIKPCSVHFSSYSQSGVLLGGEIILTPLIGFWKSLQHQEQVHLTPLLAKTKPIYTTTLPFLENYKIPVTFINRPEVIDLISTSSEISLIFSCRNVEKTVSTLLNNFKCEALGNESKKDVILSSFVILSVKKLPRSDRNFLLGIILRQVGQQVEFGKLDKVTTVSTPFGNDCFFATSYSGRVANVIGANKCLVVLSNPLVFGCEGGAVLTERKKLLGVVLATTFLWRNQHVTLTLACRTDEIVNELIQQDNGLGDDYVQLNKSLLQPFTSFPAENSVVLIDSGNSWGCGCLIKFCGKRCILTCSHVIASERLKVRWRGGRFDGKLIYRNVNFDRPYDIAILEAPKTIPEANFTALARYRPVEGSIIYAAGFPVQPFDDDFSPYIYRGRVTKYSRGILHTDTSVQAGQSGGPLFDSKGLLQGICVSNIKDEINKKIYPFVNMAVPICDIFKVMEEYFNTDDPSVLHKLIADKEIEDKWNLQNPKILKSKL